ncbi:MAG: carboxylesterase [Hyphomonadaceae bacterium TMED5]|nr:carboxylesterase [Ponticaulis sp.]OUX98828.1 MAG: carboxylesterase [Hyphomonadaceae bacterium TMED5]|tara:strand:+ start:16086 stop:17684 length:1599 start_codon:yes stop_codon:yes gene_type:complete
MCAALTATHAQAENPLSEYGVPDATPVVHTTAGDVQGFVDNGIEEYLGLRYAAPPVGELRFMPPEPVAPWDGIYDATSLGAPAMQMYTPSGPRTTEFTRQMQMIFPTLAEEKIDNEDSLFLNVWTPGADDEARPVMVWFHGGGYAYGSGGWPAYDGRNLAEYGDVVVVTVNHRLNVFGYLYLGEAFGEDYAASGNVGNLDLVASLEWVRDNIAAFGGDPDNVTIMGESGGGSKVSHLLATPAADGLFHRAIIQSGPGVTSGDAESAAQLADLFLEEAGVETPEALQALTADEISNAGRAALALAEAEGLSANFRPIVDGVVQPSHPFMPTAPAQSSDVPIMIGWNKDEMTIFNAAQEWFGTLPEAGLAVMGERFGEDGPALIAHYREARPDDAPTYIANSAMTARFVYGTYILADQRARQEDGAPVYMYQLTYETDTNGGVLRSPHTLDIPFMFDNVEESRILVGSGEAPNLLGAMMSDAWVSFARDGVPSSDLLPDWTPYNLEDRPVMRFDVDPEMVNDPEQGIREILSAN